MTEGWFNESKRHSLARKGIKTGRKMQRTSGFTKSDDDSFFHSSNKKMYDYSFKFKQYSNDIKKYRNSRFDKAETIKQLRGMGVTGTIVFDDSNNSVRVNKGNVNYDIFYDEGSDTYVVYKIKNDISRSDFEVSKFDNVYFDDFDKIQKNELIEGTKITSPINKKKESIKDIAKKVNSMYIRSDQVKKIDDDLRNKYNIESLEDLNRDPEVKKKFEKEFLERVGDRKIIQSTYDNLEDSNFHEANRILKESGKLEVISEKPSKTKEEAIRRLKGERIEYEKWFKKLDKDSKKLNKVNKERNKRLSNKQLPSYDELSSYDKAKIILHKKDAPKFRASSNPLFNKQYNKENYKDRPSQIGSVKSEVKDAEFLALPSGKRVSKNGNVYYERRKNRSDKNPKIRL